MISLLWRRVCVLGALTTAIAASGCGGRAVQPPLGSSGALRDVVASANLPHHKTFYYTDRNQYFTVPKGLRWLVVVALGAKGAGSQGGLAGRVYAQIPVSSGERLFVVVGGAGHGHSGGFDGGADGGYGGGGASDVRVGASGLVDRVIVAAGGGGEGAGETDYGDGQGGSGGGASGSTGGEGWCGSCNAGGAAQGGSGGTQVRGGSGGRGGNDGHGQGKNGLSGRFGKGGAGGSGCNTSTCSSSKGGGGGGGWYGGGGGGAGVNSSSFYYSSLGAGGGGGSSWAEQKARRYQTWRGWKTSNPNGLVVFSW